MAHVDRYHNGKKLVSATELQSVINKPFLEKWKESLCCPQQGQCGFIRAKQVAEEAGDLGNEVHRLVEEYLKGVEVSQSLNADAVGWATKIVALYKGHKVEPYLLAPEETLIDYESGLAGSPDAVIMWDGKPYISDLKIKNQLDALTGMQGMAYRYLIKRLKGVDISEMLVIHAKKRTVSKIVEPIIIDLNLWVEPWKHLVGIWNVVNPSRKVVVHA